MTFCVVSSDLLESLEPAVNLQLARLHLLDFVLATKPDYQVNWHHELLAKKLEQIAAGSLRRLIVCMPPGHGKSELVCRRFIPWLFGRSPKTRVILVTHTATLAEAHSRDIQRVMQEPSYRELFPGVRLPNPSRAAGRYKVTDEFFELPQGGYLRATGVGGAITGLRFDVGIVDDPIKGREEAESPVIRERLWQWFVSDFLTRQAADARVVVVSTRWHRDDLVGRILRQAAETGLWETVILPAICPDDPTVRHPEDPRRPGEPLWPEFMDDKRLEEIRRADPRAFAGLYQQDPAEAAGTEWPTSYFGDWIWASDWPPRGVRQWVMAVDPSRGRTDAPGDYAAIVAVGLDPERGLLFCDCRMDRWFPEEIIRETLKMWAEYRPTYLAVETNQFHGLLERDLERESLRTVGMRVPVYPVWNIEPKVFRIRRLTPYLANREIRFRADSAGCRLLVDQLRDWPLGEHDDGPDALEMAIRILAATAVLVPERHAIPVEPRAGFGA